MNKIVLSWAFILGLSACAAKVQDIPTNDISIRPEDTELYKINWARECIAGEIWNILVVACKDSRDIQLQWEIQNVERECTDLGGTSRLCIYDTSLEVLKTENVLQLLDIHPESLNSE